MCDHSACQGAGRGVNHLIHRSQDPYLPGDSELPERSSLKLVLDYLLVVISRDSAGRRGPRVTAEASQAGAFEDPAADGERPLRVALLTYKGNPFCGGQGVYVRNLSRELVRLGHQVDVFSGQPYPVLDPGVRLIEVPSLDLYREPDPFRMPKLREYRDWVDALEVGTMMTAGFPEPMTFALRARRLLRGQPDRYDVVHDNQSLGYGLLGLGRPLVSTVHHPVQIDRRLELAAATGLRRLSLRRWYGFTRTQARVARRLRHIITVSE